MKSNESSLLRRVLSRALAAVSLGLALPAWAQSSAYEGFNYPGNPQLAGLNGGSGFSGAWTGPSGVGGGSLGFSVLQTTGDNLSVGNSATAMDHGRTLAVPVTTGTVWISFLIRASTPYATGDLVGLYVRGDNAGSRIFVGAGNSTQGIDYGIGSGALVGNFNVSSGAAIAPFSTNFLVLKLERVDALNTAATLYINPTPGLSAPNVAAVGSYAYNTGNLVALGIYSYSPGAATVFDEIRLGGSYAAVAPIFSPPLITAISPSQAVAAGSAVTLSVTATGSPTLSYQWYKGGALLAGATSADLTFSPVQPADAGIYSVNVSNAFGSTSTMSGIAKVAAGGYHSFYIRRDGTLLGFGRNDLGQLGLSPNGNRLLPVPITGAVTAVAGNEYHSMFLKADGSLWATGKNASGELGYPTNENRMTPKQVAANVQAVATGTAHSLWINTDGSLWATGANHYGQLGDGSTAQRTTAVQITGNVKAIAAASTHSLLLKHDGTLWAMGRNHLGQLGDGTTTDRSTPVAIASSVASIAAGYDYSLFIKTDGTMFAMGRNAESQLGDGSMTNRSVPTQVATGVLSASAGVDHTLFLKTDGTLWGMGRNDYGQVGDGTTINRATPVQIATDVASFSAGSQHGFYLLKSGALFAYGRNDYGQLGNGTTGTQPVPQQLANSHAALTALTVLPAGLAAQWKLDGDSNDTLGRSHGVGQGVQYVTSQVLGRPQPVAFLGGAGGPNGVTVANTAALDLPSTGYTIVGWVNSPSYAPTPPPNTYFTLIASQGVVNSQHDAFRLMYGPQGLNFTVSSLDNYPAPDPGYRDVKFVRTSDSNGDVLAANRWYQIAVTYDGATIRGYVDGVALTPIGDAALAGTAPKSTTRNTAIGMRTGGATNPPSNGYVADVRIYHRALSAAELTTLASAVPPAVNVAPTDVTIVAADRAQLSVSATGAGPLAYQWFEGASGDVSKPILGAASATFTTSALVATTSYWVRVTDNNGAVINSAAAVVSVSPTSPLTVTQTVVGNGYWPGAAVTIRNVITYTGAAPTAINWATLLPNGWRFLGSGGSEGGQKPFYLSGDLLEWSWTTVPASPIEFTYSVSVPAGSTADQVIASLVSSQRSGTHFQVLAKPDPLVLRSAELHSADSNRDRRIDLTELTRVIELYNFRAGSVRTGQYKVQAGSEDGFAPGPN